MTEPARVTMIVDIACIWSYLGFSRLERTMRRVRRDGREVELCFRPFQVSPDATREGEPLTEVLERELGGYSADSEAEIKRLEARENVVLDVRSTVHANTFASLVLLDQASHAGSGEAMAERLYRAYYGEGRNVADPDVLDEIAVEMGLTRDMSRADAVAAEIAATRADGVQGVPQYLLDGLFVDIDEVERYLQRDQLKDLR